MPFRLETRNDFINLTLASCYNGIFPALKQSGEWTIYLGRKCGFLDRTEGKCSIHNKPYQSLICKSYDAHNCWYTEAFSSDRFSTMIPFNTDMMIWFERRYRLIENRFDVDTDWKELSNAAYSYKQGTLDFKTAGYELQDSFRLPFKKSRSDQYLLFPPYNRPENRNHLELLSFRLGFPGVYLAVSDTCWSFLVKTELNRSGLELFRREYFPSIDHQDGLFSFDGMAKKHHPFSETGEQWIVLGLKDLGMLKALISFDSHGNVRHIPSSADLLDALKTKRPDRAA